MLMIHVGPLFSALRAATDPHPPAIAAHVHPGGDGAHGAAHDGHGPHHRATPGAPAWLAALEMCGYCELLTLNPPLDLPLRLVLPEHQPTFVLPLPEWPHPPAPRRGDGHPRGPPVLHG